MATYGHLRIFMVTYGFSDLRQGVSYGVSYVLFSPRVFLRVIFFFAAITQRALMDTYVYIWTLKDMYGYLWVL